MNNAAEQIEEENKIRDQQYQKLIDKLELVIQNIKQRREKRPSLTVVK
jgi:hypothetical protein